MIRKPQKKSRGFWRTCRIYFRRFRIVTWLLILLLLASVLYLNQVGLPDFAKRPLLRELRSRGLDLQFSRLRLSWYQGIVAENVRFGQADTAESPKLTAREVRVGLDWRALAHRRVRVDRIVLQNGRLIWPLRAGRNSAPDQELSVENIQTDLKFLPEDMWALDHLTANFVNTRIQLAGTVTNASAVAEWPFLKGEGHSSGSGTIVWQNRVRQLADTLQKMQFSEQPELKIAIQGNARMLSSFDIRAKLSASGAQTPWGTLSEGRLTARLLTATHTQSNTTTSPELTLTVDAAQAQSPWATITNFQMEMVLTSTEFQTNVIQGRLEISADEAVTKWARARNPRFDAQWVHSITNPVPLSGSGTIQSEAADTKWGSAGNLKLSGRLSRADPALLPPCDASWAWWSNIHPYSIEWDCSIGSPVLRSVALKEISGSGSWTAPGLAITNLQASLAEGGVSATAMLDVAARRLSTALRADVDPHTVASALPETARKWLSQFAWNSTPKASGTIALMLPSWTNSAPDWAREVQPTLQINGQFAVESGGSYRQVRVGSARSHISYSNMTWHLPDLMVSGPEGNVVAEHKASDRTHDFYWRITSSVHPNAIRPLLDKGALAGLDLLQLASPPLIDAEVFGRSHAPELTSVRARVSLTNFAFRGQPASGLQSQVFYTNKILRFVQPRIQRGSEIISADGVTADFNSEFVYITNGFSTTDPMVVARAIGAKIGKAIEPYIFSNPPVARVYGTVPMHGEEGADLHFHLDGGPFHWWKFNVPRIAGHVHWAGLSLGLHDVAAAFYKGQAGGKAGFQFLPGKGADFTCSMAVTNALLQELMADLLESSSNHLEGTLSGTLNFTRANTEDWNGLFGYGELKLRDGLIWDTPLFGLFTPVLDGISPGLGHSRASAGTCSYFITNGIIRTDDLEIRAQPVRLQYRGTVDLETRVNARVEAELLKDVWLVGPIVSTVLWPVTKMFEYRVTGTLGEPRMEPVYIVPKIMFMPFHPFKTLKGLLPDDPSSKTNSLPTFQPLPR